jgi:hypothetical protein
MATMTDSMRESVRTIPGEEGFWKSSSESTYQEHAQILLNKGFSEEQTLDILSSLYYAAANCYGG